MNLSFVLPLLLALCVPAPVTRLPGLRPVRALLVRIPLGPRPSLHRLRCFRLRSGWVCNGLFGILLTSDNDKVCRARLARNKVIGIVKNSAPLHPAWRSWRRREIVFPCRQEAASSPSAHRHPVQHRRQCPPPETGAGTSPGYTDQQGVKTMRQVDGEPDSSLATSSCIEMHHQGGLRHRLSRPFQRQIRIKASYRQTGTDLPRGPCSCPSLRAAEDTRTRASNIEIGQFMSAGKSTSPGPRIGSNDIPWSPSPRRGRGGPPD